MHTQVECRFIYEVTPSLTNVKELAPPKSDIPNFLVIQPIIVEYAEEDIIIEHVDRRV